MTQDIDGREHLGCDDARVGRQPTIAEQQGCDHIRWFVSGENAEILLCDQCGATRPRVSPSNGRVQESACYRTDWEACHDVRCSSRCRFAAPVEPPVVQEQEEIAGLKHD